MTNWKRHPDFDQALKFIQDNKLAMLQVVPELAMLFNRIKRLKKKRVFVEIGNGHGSSAYILAHALPPGSFIILIDKNKPPERVKPMKELIKQGYNVVQIFGDSQHPSAYLGLKNVLQVMRIDALFIDGDHRYRQVKSDFKVYSEMVRPGGIIALHDIVKRGDKPLNEVYRLWKEIKEQYPDAVEYIYPDRKVGIGLIRKQR